MTDARSGRGRNVAYSSEWETTKPPLQTLKPRQDQNPGWERERQREKEGERERAEREANANQEVWPGDRSKGFSRRMHASICLAREGCRCFTAAVSTLRPRISSCEPRQDVAQRHLRLFADTNLTRAPVLHRAGALSPRARDGPDTKRRRRRRRRRRRESSSNKR
jgi:hypothetical protein